MKKLLAQIVIILFFVLLFPKHSFAAVIFEDNFNSYSNGSFPSKWVKYSPAPVPGCNASWTILNGEFGVNIPSQNGCADNMIPIASSWQTPLNEYIFEVDMKFVSGTDHNLPYIISPDTINPVLSTIYELHFASPGDFDLGGPISQTIIAVPQGYPNGNTYHLKIIVKPTHVTILINNNLVREVELSSPLPLGTIGLRAGVGSDPSGETWFDNVKVTSLDPVSTGLNVPSLKQTDPLWIDDLYDSANIWSTGATGIGRWGCAIASAAMVLKYNNINKLPGGIDLTPGTLNSYLKSIPNGYRRNGDTNWEAIASMTKIAKPYNPGFGFDALKVRWGGNSATALIDDLNNGIPNILEEDMGFGNVHYIVAKGISGSTFTINDPAFDRNDLNSYGNSFISTRRFIPTNTDLSYITFVVDPTVNILLKDGSGNSVGDVYSDNPISDPLNVLKNTVGSLKVVSFAEPPTDNYTFEISSTTPSVYYLQGYLYDVNGNVKMLEKKDVLSQNDTDSFTINFDKNGNSNAALQQDITFSTLRNDVRALCSLGYLKKEFCKEINEKINEIDNQHENRHDEEHKKEHDNSITKKLKELMKEIKEEKKLNSYASTILINDILALINSLSQINNPGT